MSGQSLLKNKKHYLTDFFPGANLISAISSRRFGNMSLLYADTSDSLKNRKYFLDNLGIDYRDLVCARQVHGSCVRLIKDQDKGKGAISGASALADTDAFITNRRNLPLAVFTADCLSISLYDPETPAVALIHAGWRSTRERIATKTVQLLKKEFNTRPEDLFACFSVAIRSCCYQVGGEFNELFPGDSIERNGRYYLDLCNINKKQLLGSGVKDDKIFDPGVCTSCRNEEFFSYRKEGKNCGRMMSVIMLK